MELKPGYHQTEVGVIPEDWDCLQSSELVSCFGGNAFKSKDTVNDGVRWLKIANVGKQRVNWDTTSFLPKHYVTDFEPYLLREDDVVMALTRPILNNELKIAKLTQSDVPSLLNQRVAKIVVSSRADLVFAYYVFQTRRFVDSMSDAMAGSDPPNIGTKTLGRILIAAPKDVAEQRAIATALSDVDALLDGLDRLIAKKRDLKQAAMQQLLTGKTRLPGFEGAWQIKRLGVVFSISAGKSKSAYVVEGGNYWVCDMGSVSTQGRLIVSKRTNYRGDFLERGDLVMPKDDIGGGNIIGKVGYIDANETYILGDHVYCLRALEGDPRFLAYVINSHRVNSELRKKVIGSAQLGLGRKSVNEQEIQFPQPSEQTAIATVLSDMDAEIAALEQRRNKTKDIKQAMMQELLTGKTRLVTPVENAHNMEQA